MRVTIELDGERIQVDGGRNLAGVLLERGRGRRSVTLGEVRSALCGMGSCWECRGEVDGRAGVRTCLVPVVDGMRVRTELQP